MSFVAPAFAMAGLLAVAIPITIHLLNRRRYKVLDWAAMQFLLAAMRKNRRRLQFEQWVLMATRCALVALAGLALARPVGCGDTSLARLAGQSSSLHVIVIDNSYSMAYEADRPDARTHLDEAKRLAHRLVERLNPGGDSVVLITAAQPAEAIVARPTFDLPAVIAAIDRIEQKFTGTDLAGALALADRAGREQEREPNRVLDLFSDATTSAWRGGQEKLLADIGPPLGAMFHLRHFNLSLPSQSNLAVLDVSPASNLVRTRFANDFRATARAFGASVESSLIWKLGDEPLPGGSSVQLNAQTPPITQSNAQLRAGGATVVSAMIAADDRLKADNIRYHTIEVASEMKVLIVEGRRGVNELDGSGAFLELALAPPTESTGVAGTVSYLRPERISDIELSSRVLGDYRVILLADVAQLSAPVADQLVAYVKQGGTVVWFMGEQVSRESYNTVLLPRTLIPGALAQRQTGPGFTFAFNPSGNNHALLNAFNNIDKSGLDTAQVFTYWQLSPGETKPQAVLSYAGSNDPAITLHELGDGHVIFFSTSADAEWTNFPGKSAYLALVHEIIAGSVAGSQRWMNLTVGQRVELPPTLQLSSAPTLREPGASTDQPLEQVVRADGSRHYQSSPLSKPGVYRLSQGASSIPISVNIPSEEADIRPIAHDAIRQALGGAEIETLDAELPAVAQDPDESNDFGWTLMTLVLLCLGAECVMAMRFGHYRK